MSNNVSSIITSIKSSLSNTLGSSWSEIDYSRNIEKNNNKGIKKRYGVNPQDAQEVDSQTRYITLDHNFEVILTDQYVNTPMSDSSEQTLTKDLLDKAFDCYKDFIATRLNNANVINISQYSSEPPETNDESKYVIVRFTFTVRYRTNF